MDAHFRWFEGEKAQFRFVPYDWAFLFGRLGPIHAANAANAAHAGSQLPPSPLPHFPELIHSAQNGHADTPHEKSHRRRAHRLAAADTV